jgi:hypothetical protein
MKLVKLSLNISDTSVLAYPLSKQILEKQDVEQTGSNWLRIWYNDGLL